MKYFGIAILLIVSAGVALTACSGRSGNLEDALWRMTSYRNTDGEMISGGIVRSAVRLEIRIAGPSMWIADTYTHIDGKEVQVQSYRFVKS